MRYASSFPYAERSTKSQLSCREWRQPSRARVLATGIRDRPQKQFAPTSERHILESRQEDVRRPDPCGTRFDLDEFRLLFEHAAIQKRWHSVFATILLASLGATQTIELYRARYRPAAVLVPIARNALGSEGQVTLDARTATLVLNGSPQATQRALALLEQVDLPLRQVVIESVVRDRYGAPLDTRWMAGAWSSHFEFRQELLRVRTDFFTRPPRISQADLARIWQEQAGRNIPFLDPPDLAEMKKTNRERDYAVIGELARLMEDVELQIRYSRSARDLLSLANQHAERIERIAETRPRCGR